jgi:hypothetical protein
LLHLARPHRLSTAWTLTPFAPPATAVVPFDPTTPHPEAPASGLCSVRGRVPPPPRCYPWRGCAPLSTFLLLRASTPTAAVTFRSLPSCALSPVPSS